MASKVNLCFDHYSTMCMPHLFLFLTHVKLVTGEILRIFYIIQNPLKPNQEFEQEKKPLG